MSSFYFKDNLARIFAEKTRWRWRLYICLLQTKIRIIEAVPIMTMSNIYLDRKSLDKDNRKYDENFSSIKGWLCAKTSYPRPKMEDYFDSTTTVLADCIWQQHIPMPPEMAQNFKRALCCGIRILAHLEHTNHQDLADKKKRELSS